MVSDYLLEMIAGLPGLAQLMQRMIENGGIR